MHKVLKNDLNMMSDMPLFNVRLKSTILIGFVTTYCTIERFFSSMYSNMINHKTSVSNDFSAEWTSVMCP